MNKNIKELINLLYLKNLNEDLLSDLNDEDDDSEFIFNTDKNIICVFNQFELNKAILNSHDKPGSILCYNEKQKKFYICYIINQNTDIKKYGIILAINFGKGLWITTISYMDKQRPLAWASDKTKLYYDECKTGNNGYENTQYILNKFSDSIEKENNIWKYLNDIKEYIQKYINDIQIYIPSVKEYEMIYKNQHFLTKYLDFNKGRFQYYTLCWTSNQYIEKDDPDNKGVTDDEDPFYIDSNEKASAFSIKNNKVIGVRKNNKTNCLILAGIHF